MSQQGAFQRVLYRTFILEKRWRVDDVAVTLGVSRSTLYAWIEGERTFPVDQVPTLFIATQHMEFLQFCLEGTGYSLAPLPDAGQEVGRVQEEALDVVAAVGDLAQTVRMASADGVLSQAERQRIFALVRKVQQEAEELLAAAARPSGARTPTDTGVTRLHALR